ncbi:hypothetical protein KBC31_02155 [Candidatus Saccharibacteria bacterium]|jgi:hypothetical protein|nr:hypothetical protein [Candidatus Saccharibacteria bacterium]
MYKDGPESGAGRNPGMGELDPTVVTLVGDQQPDDQEASDGRHPDEISFTVDGERFVVDDELQPAHVLEARGTSQAESEQPSSPEDGEKSRDRASARLLGRVANIAGRLAEGINNRRTLSEVTSDTREAFGARVHSASDRIKSIAQTSLDVTKDIAIGVGVEAIFLVTEPVKMLGNSVLRAAKAAGNGMLKAGNTLNTGLDKTVGVLGDGMFRAEQSAKNATEAMGRGVESTRTFFKDKAEAASGRKLARIAARADRQDARRETRQANQAERQANQKSLEANRAARRAEADALKQARLDTRDEKRQARQEARTDKADAKAQFKDELDQLAKAKADNKARFRAELDQLHDANKLNNAAEFAERKAQLDVLQLDKKQRKAEQKAARLDQRDLDIVGLSPEESAGTTSATEYLTAEQITNQRMARREAREATETTEPQPTDSGVDVVGTDQQPELSQEEATAIGRQTSKTLKARAEAALESREASARGEDVLENAQQAA